MDRRGGIALLICVLGLTWLAGEVRAAGAPRFHLDAQAWEATHVVVVREDSKQDGSLQLVEIWTGPKAERDVLRLPRLSTWGRDAMGRAHKGLRVTGKRMVLFLDLEHDAETRIWSGHEFVPSDAMCWIESGKAYGMIGRGSREGPLVGPLSLSEQALRSRVEQLTAVRTQLAQLKKTEDPHVRLAGVAALVNPEDRVALRDVFEVVASCGTPAVPLLVSHLDGPLFWRACRTLRSMGDRAAVPALVARVERELVFWRDAKAALPDGSWQKLPTRKRRTYEDRMGRLHTLLDTLRHVPSEDAVDVLQRVRAVWTAAPAFQETPYGYIVRACDAALHAAKTAGSGTSDG